MCSLGGDTCTASKPRGPEEVLALGGDVAPAPLEEVHERGAVEVLVAQDADLVDVAREVFILDLARRIPDPRQRSRSLPATTLDSSAAMSLVFAIFMGREVLSWCRSRFASRPRASPGSVRGRFAALHPAITTGMPAGKNQLRFCIGDAQTSETRYFATSSSRNRVATCDVTASRSSLPAASSPATRTIVERGPQAAHRLRGSCRPCRSRQRSVRACW